MFAFRFWLVVAIVPLATFATMLGWMSLGIVMLLSLFSLIQMSWSVAVALFLLLALVAF
jgi:hypothetical protein